MTTSRRTAIWEAFSASILVGMSIAATLFSGISFLGYPSVVYKHGIMLMLMLVPFPICWVILRYWFLPRYLRIKSDDPYGFIEINLGKDVRNTAAVMFALLRIGWMAALIYAPTIAIMAAARLNSSWFWPLVLIIGISSSLYTALGGIRGVIITDANPVFSDDSWHSVYNSICFDKIAGFHFRCGKFFAGKQSARGTVLFLLIPLLVSLSGLLS